LEQLMSEVQKLTEILREKSKELEHEASINNQL
jgi:hypothetical protein